MERGKERARTEEIIDGWLLTVIEVLNFFGPKRPIADEVFFNSKKAFARGFSVGRIAKACES